MRTINSFLTEEQRARFKEELKRREERHKEFKEKYGRARLNKYQDELDELYKNNSEVYEARMEDLKNKGYIILRTEEGKHNVYWRNPRNREPKKEE